MSPGSFWGFVATVLLVWLALTVWIFRRATIRGRERDQLLAFVREIALLNPADGPLSVVNVAYIGSYARRLVEKLRS